MTDMKRAMKAALRNVKDSETTVAQRAVIFTVAAALYEPGDQRRVQAAEKLVNA